MKNKLALIFILFCLTLSVFAEETAAWQYTLPDDFTVETDASVRIPFTAADKNGKTAAVTYTSSDPDIAAIFGGSVRGFKPGTAALTALLPDGAAVSFPVTVVRPVRNIKLDHDKTIVDLYGTILLNAAVSPEDAGTDQLRWTSSDETVAVVDANGLVTTLSTGISVIRATAHNGISASCVVTVQETKPTFMRLDRLFITMHPGEERTVSAFFEPESAQNQSIILNSSDPSVVTVGENDVLIAVREGTATVSVQSAASPALTCSCRVSVISPDALPLSGLIIGINPGHGGVPVRVEDPDCPGSFIWETPGGAGATGTYTGIPEYETTLAVSLKLADLLRAQGAEVVLTRTENNVDLSSESRAYMLNAAHVDMAIQVHCDDGGVGGASGISTYYRTTGSRVPESKSFADILASHVSAETGAVNRGSFICNTYQSLNHSSTPAVLIEMGFLDNETEDYLLADDAYRGKLAQGILNAIADYFDRAS